MNRKSILLILTAAACLAAQGCTSRAWYAGFQAAQRQQCYKKISRDEVQQCLDRVSGVTYDDYKKAREDARRGDK
ncbi:MAG TPA: hypothetical protein VKA13_06755 [Gammaproteobacteria bacterium]|nr:hypothetical protein [Gammaproteobacteria bacterium]